MNFSELEQLFYQNDLDSCILQGEAYLAQSPDDTEVIFLLAVAYHDRQYYDGHEEVFDAIQQYTIPYLRRILELNPMDTKALYNILSYPLGNQYALWNIARPKLHIVEENKLEFIEYCQRLTQIPGHEIYGYDFLIKIYEGLHDVEHQLMVIDSALTFNEHHFRNERETRDKNMSIFLMKKIYLLDQYEGFDKADLAVMIATHLPKFVSQNESQYIDLAEIAYEQQAIDLSLQILMQLLDANQSTHYVIGEFCKWHERFEQQIAQGYNHPDVYYFQLIIERNYYETLGLTNDFYYHHALTICHLLPNHYFGHHFAGTYLFENGEYEQALPHLQTAITIYPIATTCRRYIESHIYVHHAVPELPILQSHPLDMYGIGTELDELICEIDIPHLAPALLQIRLACYQQAYDAFKAYFEIDTYISLYCCDYHHRAMCCNNLAIAHSSVGQYGSAAEIAEEGLAYSDFWELHSTVIDAHINHAQYPQAKEALTRYFETYGQDEVPFLKHLIFEAHRIAADYNLGAHNDLLHDAKILLGQIYDYAAAHPDLEEYDLRDVEAAKTAIQSVHYNMIREETDEYKLTVFEKEAAKYPNESNPCYMLMQLYHDTAQFDKCNQAAYRYLANKPVYLLDDFDKAKALHFIMKSHLLCEEYDQALIVYEENKRTMRDLLPDADYITWLIRAVTLKKMLHDHEHVLELAQMCRQLYLDNEWEYDADLEAVYLAQAEAYYHTDKLKQAHAVLDEILQYDDADAQAHIFKSTWKKPGFLSKFGF